MPSILNEKTISSLHSQVNDVTVNGSSLQCWAALDWVFLKKHARRITCHTATCTYIKWLSVNTWIIIVVKYILYKPSIGLSLCLRLSYTSWIWLITKLGMACHQMTPSPSSKLGNLIFWIWKTKFILFFCLIYVDFDGFLLIYLYLHCTDFFVFIFGLLSKLIQTFLSYKWH